MLQRTAAFVVFLMFFLNGINATQGNTGIFASSNVLDSGQSVIITANASLGSVAATIHCYQPDYYYCKLDSGSYTFQTSHAYNSMLDCDRGSLYVYTCLYTYGYGGSSSYSYEWFVNGKKVSTNDTLVLNRSNTVVGKNNIAVKISSLTGKIQSFSTVVNSNPSPKTALNPGTAYIKQGESVAFSNTSGGGSGPYNYFYSVAPLTGYTRYGNLFTFTKPGDYIITLNVIDAQGEYTQSVAYVYVSATPASSSQNTTPSNNGSSHAQNNTGGNTGSVFNYTYPTGNVSENYALATYNSSVSSLCVSSNPYKSNTLEYTLCSVANTIRELIVVTALFMFIFGAMLYAVSHFLPSAGNLKGSSQAWAIGMMIGGIIGIILIAVAPFIVNTFANAGGLNPVPCC